MLFIFGWNWIGGSFALFLIVQAGIMALAVQNQPEMWTIARISAEDMNLILEKALAKSGCCPERTLTGLKFEQGFTLKISHATCIGSNAGLLTWEPSNSWRRLPEFKANLLEALSHCKETVDHPSLRLIEVAWTLLVALCMFVMLLPPTALEKLSNAMDCIVNISR